MKKVVIFGGAGFIGRRLAACLSEAGAEVTVATRDRERSKADIVVLPGAAAVSYRPQDTLDHLTRGADVVVNLVGILHDSKRLPFEVAHEEFTRRLLAASARARVSHFVQMSALGAAPGAPSRYLRSKSKAERLALDAVDKRMSATILRPSVVFGEGDKFINLFAALARRLPILAVPCARAQMQPIAVDDLARAAALAVLDARCKNRILFLGGPQTLTLLEIVEKTARASGHPRALAPLGAGLSQALAWLMEKIPFLPPLITADNCRSMRAPSVCPPGQNDAQKLLGDLQTLDAGLRTMFGRAGARGAHSRLAAMRARARR